MNERSVTTTKKEYIKESIKMINFLIHDMDDSFIKDLMDELNLYMTENENEIKKPVIKNKDHLKKYFSNRFKIQHLCVMYFIVIDHNLKWRDHKMEQNIKFDLKYS